MRRYFLFPIGLLSLALFVELGIVVKAGPLAIDTSVALWFKSHRTPGEVHWAQVISSLTAPIVVLIAAVLLLLFYNYWTRSWYPRDFIPLALIGTCAVISTMAKPFFDRARPGINLSTMYDLEPSYPSSHTVFIAAIGCSVLFIETRRQFLTLVVASLITIFIGVERLVIGVHWVTDIIGSVFLSFGMFIIFYALDDWLAERERNGL